MSEFQTIFGGRTEGESSGEDHFLIFHEFHAEKTSKQVTVRLSNYAVSDVIKKCVEFLKAERAFH